MHKIQNLITDIYSDYLCKIAKVSIEKPDENTINEVSDAIGDISITAAYKQYPQLIRFSSGFLLNVLIMPLFKVKTSLTIHVARILVVYGAVCIKYNYSREKNELIKLIGELERKTSQQYVRTLLADVINIKPPFFKIIDTNELIKNTELFGSEYNRYSNSINI